MMGRIGRRQALVLTVALIVAPRIALGQARQVRIGVLAPRKDSILLPAPLKRLAELGFVDGKNLTIDYRSADGVAERMPSLARELISANCDLIFAVGSVHAVLALVDAKTRVPIVILANDYDPVAAGIIPNLQRPGGNVTGVVLSVPETAAKRLEIMKQILPNAKRVLVLGDAFSEDALRSVRTSAKALQVEIVAETFTRRPYDLNAAFEKGRAAGVGAAIVLTSPVLFDLRKELADIVAKQRLPVATSATAWGTAGFLYSYGPNYTKAFARAGDIAANILRGAKPGEIPVEQATEFEFTLNLKTARALGITIPYSVLVRADRVIE